MQTLLNLDTRSNRFLTTIGTSISLLLALNLGIIIHSHFLMPPYNASQTITYFLAFTGAIGLIIYKTIQLLDEPSNNYIEGLVLGVSGGTTVLLYLPSLLFTPMAKMFPDVLPFFAATYIISIIITTLLVIGIVYGSETYADERNQDMTTTPESNDETADKTTNQELEADEEDLSSDVENRPLPNEESTEGSTETKEETN